MDEGENPVESELEGEAKDPNKQKTMIGLAVIMILLLTVIFTFILGPIVWQLGIFNMGDATESSVGVSHATSMGFSVIKPNLGAIQVSKAGEFNGMFTNGAGTEIAVDVNSIKISEIAVGACRQIRIDGSNKVASGEKFAVKATECPVDESYNLNIEIPYSINLSGTILKRSDMGAIRGNIPQT